MKFRKLSEKKWYPGAVAACIGVLCYVLLSNFSGVLSGVGSFLGNFRIVFLAFVMAYIMNPLADFFYYKLFSKMKLGKLRWTLSVTLTVLTALLAVGLLLGMLIPQLLESILLFSSNYESYAASLMRLIKGGPLESLASAAQLEAVTDNALNFIAGQVQNNAGRILGIVANSGKSMLSVLISLILAVYVLADKKRVMGGVWRFARAVMPKEKYEVMMDLMLRCDVILRSYIGQNLLDSLIIGGANALLMLVFRMQYVGLISVVVGVTNLIPNFGPYIGLIIGAFILLLVNPVHALLFILFCIVLQFTDAYILKPKLFSSSLGVSGLLILISTIVLGNMFGVVGMLLAIPAAAILSFLYHDYFLPRRENHRAKRESDPGTDVPENADPDGK